MGADRHLWRITTPEEMQQQVLPSKYPEIECRPHSFKAPSTAGSLVEVPWKEAREWRVSASSPPSARNASVASSEPRGTTTSSGARSAAVATRCPSVKPRLILSNGGC